MKMTLKQSYRAELTKTSKSNGYDTIEIDLVLYSKLMLTK